MRNRFFKLRDDMLNERKDKNAKCKLFSAKELSAEMLDKTGIYISESRIKKLETDNPEVKIDKDVILAYKKFFNVTADWLLDKTVETKELNSDIAITSKTTGLNDKSIETLKKLDREHRNILNFILSDYYLFSTYLSNLSLYFDNNFDTPVHYDKGIFVESDDITSNSILSTNGEKMLSIGRKLNYEVDGKAAYETIHVPVSILESHALYCLQKIMNDWKKDYKKE